MCTKTYVKVTAKGTHKSLVVDIEYHIKPNNIQFFFLISRIQLEWISHVLMALRNIQRAYIFASKFWPVGYVGKQEWGEIHYNKWNQGNRINYSWEGDQNSTRFQISSAFQELEIDICNKLNYTIFQYKQCAVVYWDIDVGKRIAFLLNSESCHADYS